MTLPSDMLALAISHPGGPEVLQRQRWPIPSCGEDEVLIRIGAAGVNGPDLFQRAGQYDPPQGASPLPGLEVAGEIVAVGTGVSGFTMGDRVMALTNGGGYAEFVAVPMGQVIPIPRGWTMAEAAALPETWFTVTQGLVMRAGLGGGMTVLVHGASGGIGGAAIQIATAMSAKAIGVVSSPEKAAYVRELGAFATIDYGRENVLERVMALTDGRGVDRVLDVVGAPVAGDNIAACARGGHIVQVATLGGAKAEINLRALMAKDLTLSGSTLRPQQRAIKAAIAQRIRTDLLPRISEAGFRKPRITPFGLEAAADAHRLMESREHWGKLVLLTAWGRTQA